MLQLRLPPVGLLAVLLVLLHNTTATPAVDISLHQQGVLQVPENGIRQVVCEVRYSSDHDFLTIFTWDEIPVHIGHPHLISGLLNVVVHHCHPRHEGRVCELFTLTIRGLPAANDSTVGCYTRDLATYQAKVAVGRVHVMLTTPVPQTEAATGMVQAPSPTVTITVTTTPATSLLVATTPSSSTSASSAPSPSSSLQTPVPTPGSTSTGSTPQAAVSVTVLAFLVAMAASLHY